MEGNATQWKNVPDRPVLQKSCSKCGKGVGFLQSRYRFEEGCDIREYRAHCVNCGHNSVKHHSSELAIAEWNAEGR